jgi:thioredoxin 1
MRCARVCLLCLVLTALTPAARAAGAPLFPLANQVTLVHFEADWCRPCRYLERALAAIAPAYAGRVAFIAVDFDRERALATSLGISAVPTTLIYDRSGNLAARRLGYLDEADLCRLLDTVLGGNTQ